MDRRGPAMGCVVYYDGKIIHESHDEYGKIVVAQTDAFRSLYFDSNCKQSTMSLWHPAVLALRYTQAMMASLLLVPEPRSALLIGLGGGSLANFLLHYFPALSLDVVELRPRVVEVAHGYFRVPEADHRLNILIADGFEYVRTANRSYDLILVDAYQDAGPVNDAVDGVTLNAYARLLDDQGVLALNLWNRPCDHFSKVWKKITRAFSGQALQLALARQNSNAIVLASKERLPDINSEFMATRARLLEKAYGIDFPSWLRLLRVQNKSWLSRVFAL